MTTRIVNIRTDDYDMYIGRRGHGKDGYFGNPFYLSNESERAKILLQYKQYFYHRIKNDAEFKLRISELKDKILGCFCSPKPCHGDIIAKYLDEEYK